MQDVLDRDYAGAIAADLLLAPVAPAWGKGFGGDAFNWLLWNQRGLVEWESPPTIAILCAGTAGHDMFLCSGNDSYSGRGPDAIVAAMTKMKEAPRKHCKHSFFSFPVWLFPST